MDKGQMLDMMSDIVKFILILVFIGLILLGTIKLWQLAMISMLS